MNEVIARNESLRRLLDGGWIHLFGLDRSGRIRHRYAGDLTWWEVGAPRREVRMPVPSLAS
jgi:hypothetical protein